MFDIFFSHLGIGLIVSLAFVPLRRLGAGFFRFNALLALAFLLLAAAFRWQRQPVPPWDLVGCIALTAAFVVSLRFRSRGISQLLLALAVSTGLVAIVRAALDWNTSSGVEISRALLAAHFVTAAGLLGAVLLAMILGHWYLVIPGLSFVHLRRITLLLAAALLLRLAVVSWSIVAGWSFWESAWQLDATGFLLQHGFFLALRLLFGIAGPAVLLLLIWECVRIRSNTSATGILYVATAVVLIGEIASHWFLASSAILL
jgi:GNAT superfamily N-acetyltransferase